MAMTNKKTADVKIKSELKSLVKLKAKESPVKATPTPARAQSPIKTAEPQEELVYDYMKYGKKKKKGYALPKKHVSFKRVVELITFTEDWKIKSRTEGNLRSEEEQRKNTNMKRNF